MTRTKFPGYVPLRSPGVKSVASKIQVDPVQNSLLEKQLQHARKIGDSQRARIRERRRGVEYIFCKDCGSVDVALTDDIEKYMDGEPKCPECGSTRMEAEGSE